MGIAETGSLRRDTDPDCDLPDLWMARGLRFQSSVGTGRITSRDEANPCGSDPSALVNQSMQAANGPLAGTHLQHDLLRSRWSDRTELARSTIVKLAASDPRLTLHDPAPVPFEQVSACAVEETGLPSGRS